MSRKLIKGKSVCVGGRTFKDKVPEHVIKSMGLKDSLFVQPEPVKQNNQGFNKKS